jgi:replicative superfamily II helicase
MLHRYACVGSQPTSSRRSALLTDHVHSHPLTFCLVIIKGTQVYDNSKGSFVDLSVLDVLQVFGRAGRPGLATSGQGFICTTADKLQHYLDAVTSQVRVSCLDSLHDLV